MLKNLKLHCPEKRWPSILYGKMNEVMPCLLPCPVRKWFCVQHDTCNRLGSLRPESISTVG